MAWTKLSQKKPQYGELVLVYLRSNTVRGPLRYNDDGFVVEFPEGDLPDFYSPEDVLAWAEFELVR